MAKQVFKVGEAPWEQGQSSQPQSFEVGKAPWETGEARPVPVRQEQFPGEGYVRGGLKALPAAGAIVGGVLGTGLGPGGIAGGGMLGAAGGRALENIGESLLGDQKTRQDIYVEPAKDAAFEGLLTGAGGLIGRGAKVAGRYIKAPIENMLARLSQPAKEGAKEIIESAERLGTKPTKGMLTDQPFVQKLESSLAQTPSKAGQEVADKFTSVKDAMKGGAEKVFEPSRTALTNNQLSQSAREIMQSGITKKLEPAVSVYNTLEDTIGARPSVIGVAEKSLSRVASNISKLPYVKILGSAEEGFANQINKNLANIKNLQDLRNLRSYVGKVAGDNAVPSTMRNTAGEIYDKLSRLEQSSINRAVFDLNPTKSKAIGTEIIKKIRGANKVYASVSNELKDLAKQSGMGKIRNYADFERKLTEMSDEKLLSTFLKPNNAKLLGMVQKQFPEAFDTMKKAKLMEIYNKSLVKGEISIPKLLNNAKNIKDPGVQEMLFGKDGAKTLKDIETVYNSMPARVGPSGTPEGIEYMGFNPFSPSSWYRELASQAKAKVLENPQLFTRFKPITGADRVLKEAKPITKPQVVSRKLKESTVPRGLLAPLEEKNDRR